MTQTIPEPRQGGVAYSTAGSRDGLPHKADRFSGGIRDLVERWNHRSQFLARSDLNNYVDGNVEFLFEYVKRRGANATKINATEQHGIGPPSYVTSILAKPAIGDEGGKIRNLSANDIAGQPLVFTYWGKKPMLVDEIDSVEMVEKFIPSKLTMGLQINKALKKGWGDPIGQSVLHGFIKPCGRLGKGELNGLPLSFACGEGGDDFPIDVVQCAPEVVERVGEDFDNVVYDGFVLFGERGAITGLCIRLDDVRERALFCENVVKIGDVFRGPINLAVSTICHVKDA